MGTYLFIALGILAAVAIYTSSDSTFEHSSIVSALIDCLILVLGLAIFLHSRISTDHGTTVSPKLFLKNHLVLIPTCAMLLVMLISRSVWNGLRTLLILGQSFALIMVSREKPVIRAAASLTVPETIKERASSFNERQPILDLLHQGYFVCRNDVFAQYEIFSLTYSNKKAKEIIQNLHATQDDFAEKLVAIDDSEKTLSYFIQQFFADDIPCGLSNKVFLRPFKRKKSDVDESGFLPQTADEVKARPFTTYKANIIKATKNMVVLALSEHSVTSAWLQTESLSSAIVCTLSHEIKTLLNGIVGNLELLGKSESRDGEYNASHNIATCSSNLLVNRLNDLFDYLQLKNKEFKLHCIEFELDELVKDLRTSCAWLANQKQIRFEIIRQKFPRRTMIGDLERIMQVVLSLTTKTLEFTDCGGSVSLEICQTKSKKAAFRVRSYGPSMQLKLEKHIKNLSPFARGRLRSTSHDSPNTVTQNLDALSLQISELIAKEMGTNLIMKTLGEKYIELKFSVRDGFPSPRLHAIPSDSPGGKQRRYSNHLHMQKLSDFTLEELACSPVKNDQKECMSKTKYGSNPPKPSPKCVQNVSENAMSADNIIRSHRKNTEDTQLIMDKLKKSVSPEREIPSELQASTRVSLPASPSKRLLTSVNVVTATSTQRSAAPRPFEETKMITLPTPQKTPKMRSRRVTMDETMEQPRSLHSLYFDDISVCRVLVVDDNTLNRYVLKSLLKKYGLNSMEASDGMAAVQLIERYLKLDKLSELILVFMDLQMPVMNGIEAVERICSMCSEAKCSPPAIVGISSDSVEEDRKRGCAHCNRFGGRETKGKNFFRAGIVEFVSKPINEKKLT